MNINILMSSALHMCLAHKKTESSHAKKKEKEKRHSTKHSPAISIDLLFHSHPYSSPVYMPNVL